MTTTAPRVVIYARASLDMTGLGESTDRQENSCRLKAASHGWDVVTVVKETVSGYGKKKRPGWERVLDMVKAGEVDIILAWHLDRITRSMLDLEALIGVVEASGVVVRTVEGDFNLDSDLGKLVARILSAVARAEVERKGARQRHANAARAQAGMPYTAGPRPVGYEKDQMTIREDEALEIKRAATDILDGVPLKEIARRWTELGIGSGIHRRGGSGVWSGGSVKRTVLNPRYIGRRIYKGEDVGPGAWPHILDEDTQKALHAKLNEPNRFTAPPAVGRTPQNLLTSIAKCAVCGEVVKALASAHGLRYACRPHAHVSPPRPLMDKAVHEWVIGFLSRPSAVAFLVAGDERAEAAQAELERVAKKMDELAAAFRDDVIDLAQYKAATEALKPLMEGARKVVGEYQRGTALRDLAVGTEAVKEQWMALPLRHQRTVIEHFCDITINKPAGYRYTADDLRITARV